MHDTRSDSTSPSASSSGGNSIDPRRTVLRLRDDLVAIPRKIGGVSVYVVEDLLTGKFFRLGKLEYAVAILLDGQRTLAEVIRHAESLKERAVTRDDTLRICNWLVYNGLAQHSGGSSVTSSMRPAAKPRHGFNPMFIRIPLLSPDALLERLQPWLGWLHTPAAMLGVLALSIVAGLQIISGWDRFFESASSVFSVERGFYLMVAWIVLKFAHELGHGLACKRYGAHVREAGIGLILFAPVPYVDVTSSWRLRSKWARIHIAAAGIYAEAIFGTLAIFLWRYTENRVVEQLCVDVAAMATLTTLAFNANPLSRFDGYYILADWLEVPNLSLQGQQFVASLARRWLLGEQVCGQPSTPWTVRLYGILSWWWRFFVSISLTCAAAMLFHGAGIVVALFAIGGYFIRPAANSIRYACRNSGWRGLRRPATVVSLGGGSLVLAASVLPWPFPRQSPGMVEFDPFAIVRAGSPGFVRQIYRRTGEFVQTGDKIAELENDQLTDERKLIELSMQASQLRCRLHRQRGEMAACQTEEEKLAALQQQFTEKNKQVESLVIVAPSAGQILGRNLESLVGTYCRQGQELCRVGFEDHKEIQALIHQDDVEAYRDHAGKKLVVRSPEGLISAELSVLVPRADDQVTQAALCAPYGGPLPVQTGHEGAANESFRLLEPRIVGRLKLDVEQSRRLHAGQLCTVMARGPQDTIAAVMFERIRRWFAIRLSQ